MSAFVNAMYLGLQLQCYMDGPAQAMQHRCSLFFHSRVFGVICQSNRLTCVVEMVMQFSEEIHEWTTTYFTFASCHNCLESAFVVLRKIMPHWKDLKRHQFQNRPRSKINLHILTRNYDVFNTGRLVVPSISLVLPVHHVECAAKIRW